ncbi:hypothetical protein M0R45_002658 [Rubus argutus]|uniref:Uncharacterized protein n=1 Tax=Rubus argutus TaxID=59490 RepID=A0AAW1VRF7_RUBAR
MPEVVISQVSITLETSKTLSRRFVHPSQKNSLQLERFDFGSMYRADMLVVDLWCDRSSRFFNGLALGSASEAVVQVALTLMTCGCFN